MLLVEFQFCFISSAISDGKMVVQEHANILPLRLNFNSLRSLVNMVWHKIFSFLNI